MIEQKRSERVTEREQQLARAEAHPQEHRAQEGQLLVTLKPSLALRQGEKNWRAEAQALEGLGRALHRTTRRLVAHELGSTEADVLRQNKAVLEQARAFLDELQIASAEELYGWLVQTEDQEDG